MLLLIAGALFPVFALIGIGFGLGKVSLLGDHGFDVLNRFVVSVTLPTLTFHTLAGMSASTLAQPVMAAAVLGGALLVYGSAFAFERVLGRGVGNANIVALGASYGNTAFVALPLALIVLGSESLAPVAVAIALNASVVFGLGVVVGQVALSEHGGLAQGLRRAFYAIFSNPLIVSALLGAGWAVIGHPLPQPLDIFLRMLGSATAPCALVAIGLFLSRQRMTAFSPVLARIAILKLVALPLVTVGLLSMLPPIPPIWAKAAILCAAVPTGTSSFLLAGGAGKWAMETSSLSIVGTTIASVVTLAITLSCLGLA